MDNKVVTLSVIIAVVLGGLWLLSKNQEHKDCEARAVKASIETYPIGEYPNITQRTQLQQSYEQRYKESCK